MFTRRVRHVRSYYVLRGHVNRLSSTLPKYLIVFYHGISLFIVDIKSEEIFRFKIRFTWTDLSSFGLFDHYGYHK